MDLLWIVLSAVAIFLGLAGCFLPVLPGPPMAWCGLLVLQLTEKQPFTTQQLVIWALVVAIVTILDYVVPIYGTKKFGGSKAGTWGSTIGLVAGLFMGPLGIIVGPFVGALVGELIIGQKFDAAFKAALGSFIGFLTGVVAKLAVVIGMIIHVLWVML